MKKVKCLILSLGLMFGFGLLLAPVGVSAYNPLDNACQGSAVNTAVCYNRDKDQAPGVIQALVNGLLYILGSVSVVVIIFAGIFYTTSIGDAANVTKAKNTLLYAVVGLIVALLAYALVNFVIFQLMIPTSTSTTPATPAAPAAPATPATPATP